jgi:cytochrome c oxidase assembly protein subunit 15
MTLSLFSKITLVSIFLVVLAGSVVRMTGSGMGCPDWPKCFDCYIPPTDASQLPSNYKEIYSEKREGKIKRFGDFLTSLGFEDEAKELIADKSLLEEQDFNAFNTWTEYINRLTGALAGMLILAQTIWAFASFKKRKVLSILAVILLFLTGFQAWFGAMVVATNIVPWVLTTHMMIAVLMILIQLHIIKLASSKEKVKVTPLLFYITLGSVILMLVQTLWGTQVRQQIDVLSETLLRENWMENLVGIFFYHRTMAIVIILIGITIFYFAKKENARIKSAYWILSVVLIEGLIGRLFSMLEMPAILQPVHLILSMVLLSILYFNLINFKIKR